MKITPVDLEKKNSSVEGLTNGIVEESTEDWDLSRLRTSSCNYNSVEVAVSI